MERFLREYVKMYAESNGIKINAEQLDNIVNNIQGEDEIWDTLDYYVSQELEEMED